MQDFLISEIFMDSLNFVLLLACLILILHLLLVWPRNLSRTSWKRVDYFWLGVATIGLLSLAAEVRVSEAKGWLQLEKARAVAILEIIELFIAEPESSHFCVIFVRGEYSPPEFDARQHQYQQGCEWRKSVARYLAGLDKQNAPPLKFDDLPRVNFDDPGLLETVVWLKERLDDYGEQQKKISETQNASTQRAWEAALVYFAPFLLCFAIALRITKVTGEIRHLEG